MNERVTLTPERLSEEGAERVAWIESSSAVRAIESNTEAMLAALALVPDGFRVERVRGPAHSDGSPARDRGAEFTVFDERGRIRVLVGYARRRRIGDQRISWSKRDLADLQHARAFAALMILAVADAEAHGWAAL